VSETIRAIVLVAIGAGLSAGTMAAGGPPPDVGGPPPGAQKLPSGVSMRVLRAGHGAERARDNDCVKLWYTGWTRDGALVGSRRAAEPANECLRTMFPALAEAVKRMAVGEQRRVWAPAAAGSGSAEGKPDLDLTFDVELVEIIKAPSVPPDLQLPPPSATKMPSGLALRVLKRGNGKPHPAESGRVKLHFSGWTADGALIESSVMAQRPAVFEMVSVMPGWREALLQMVPGEKVRLWIPARLAFGEKPRRGQPKGDLVYELELLSIE
jgi:peptidylprolyl isomerase